MSHFFNVPAIFNVFLYFGKMCLLDNLADSADSGGLHFTMRKQLRMRENAHTRTFWAPVCMFTLRYCWNFLVVRYMNRDKFVFTWPISKMHFSMQKRPRAHVFGSCVHVHAPMWLKFFLWLNIWLKISLSLHDQSLKCILLWVNGLYLKIHILTLSQH